MAGQCLEHFLNERCSKPPILEKGVLACPKAINSSQREAARSASDLLARVTGMATPEDWHNTGLILTPEDMRHLTQEWSYEYKGKKGITTLHFTRTQ
jgi:hypothetical protein